MNSLLAQFITEAGELVEKAGEALLALERDPGDDDRINALFRAVHTIKGSAGLFEIPALIQLVHAGEDLLVAVRDHRLLLDPAMTDKLLAAMDRVKGWLADLAATGQLPDDACESGRSLADELRAFIPADDKNSAAAATSAVKPPVSHVDLLLRIPEEALLEAFGAAAAGDAGDLLAISYVPEPQCFFNGQDPLHLVGMVPDVLAVHVGARGEWPPLDLIDPYTCNLVFTVVCAASRHEVQHLFRYVADQLTIAPLSIAALITPRGYDGGGQMFDDFATAAAEQCKLNDHAGLVEAAEALLERCDPELYATSVVRWIAAVARAQGAPGAHLAAMLAELVLSLSEHRSFDAGRVRLGQGPETPLLDVRRDQAGKVAPPVDPLFKRIVQEQRRILDLPGSDADLTYRIASIGRTIASLLASTGRDEAKAQVAAAAEAATLTRSAQPLIRYLDALIAVDAPPEPPAKCDMRAAAMAEGAATATGPMRTIRVERSKIDVLMNLIGELVVAKNGLSFTARRAEDVYGSRALAREIREQFVMVDRLTQEMQAAILQVRTLPVAQLFQRFPRLVRDLARTLGKQVDLVLDGETTEADKNVIEGLGEPLIHLMRNSLDHGIETPDDRVAAGKLATGTIRLAARQEGDCVIIEVTDDGRGIDPDCIKAKALELHLIDAEQAAALSDDEAVQLVLLPGFTTLTATTDISGRGVGMDVVRSAVEREGGRLILSSQRGLGTTCRLYLPLSMAITRVMVVETAGHLFGVPMEVIAEAVRVPSTGLRRIKAAETMVLRDAVIPVLRMRRLLGLPDDDRHRDSEAVMVVRLSNHLVGVVIDHFRDGIDIVLKPLDRLIGNISAYAGTAILGDGRVLPVLNIRALL